MTRALVRPNNGYAVHFRLFEFRGDGREVRLDADAKRDGPDVPGQPLVVCRASWDYLKQEAGRALVFEPLESDDRAADAAVRRERDAARNEADHLRRQLQEERDSAKAMLDEFKSQLETAQREQTAARTRAEELKTQLDVAQRERDAARARSGELEALLEAASKKGK